MMKQTNRNEQMSNTMTSAAYELTDREVHILRMLFSGQCSTAVAKNLGISKRTVDFHLAHAYVKMGVANRYDAFRKAIELGVISE